jgi:MFS family permease
VPADTTLPSAALRPQRLIPILVLIGLVMGGNGMVTPMLSFYAREFGVGGTLIGMVVTLFGVGRLVANFPAGVLSERYGRRPFLCLGPALIAVGAVGAALATSFDWLLVWRFVQGFGSGVYMTVSATILVEITRPGERGRVMALYQGALLAGAGVGPAIGGVLAAHLGYAAPFWAFGGVAIVAFLVAVVTFEEPPKHAPAPGRPQEKRSFAALLGELPFVMLCIITFGTFLTRTASNWLLIPLLGQEVFGLSVDIVGLALAVIATANFLMLPIVGPAIDRLGSRAITIGSTLLTGAALVGLAVSRDLWLFWTAVALLGAAGGFNGPSVGAALADRIPAGLYGPGVGFQRAVGDAGFVAGPILVGLIYDLTGGSNAAGLLANGGLMLLAGLAFALGTPRRRDG